GRRPAGPVRGQPGRPLGVGRAGPPGGQVPDGRVGRQQPLGVRRLAGPGAAEHQGAPCRAGPGCIGPGGTAPADTPAVRLRCLNDSGDETTGPGETFDDRTDAEAWFADSWPGLLEEGVHAVTLLESTDGAEREVYGPMSLHQAS